MIKGNNKGWNYASAKTCQNVLKYLFIKSKLSSLYAKLVLDSFLRKGIAAERFNPIWSKINIVVNNNFDF